MKPLNVINDLHIGTLRVAGTTPASAWELRKHIWGGYEKLLEQISTDLLINGDLFDTASIPMFDLLQAVKITTNWLESKGQKLVLVAGNHDLSKNSTVLSSFQFFAKLLSEQYPDRVTVVQGSAELPEYEAYVISHVANQDLFDIELSAVPECRFLFLHCNYDNKFAAQADHSLNLSEDVARSLPVDHIILGHEHQQGHNLSGKVVIVGNQIPSSVADCLGNSSKHRLSLTDSGIERVVVWSAAEDFAELDWTDLKESSARFIRIVGNAQPEDAAGIVTSIAKYRAKSQAFVITNSVSIAGQDQTEELAQTLEQVQGFDIFSAVLSILSDDEATKIKKLYEEFHTRM